MLEQRWSVRPWQNLLVPFLLDTTSSVARDGNEGDFCFRVEASSLEERCELANDLVVSSMGGIDISSLPLMMRPARSLPLFRVLHSRVIHLVDGDNQLLHTSSLDKHDMLSSLSTFFKSSLEFTLSCRNNQDSYIRLSSTRNHAWHKRLVAWCIQDRVPALVGLEVGTTDFNCLSF